MKKPVKVLPDRVECKEQAPEGEPKLMPITDMTTESTGSGFVIGVGGNKPEQQANPKRAPLTCRCALHAWAAGNPREGRRGPQ